MAGKNKKENKENNVKDALSELEINPDMNWYVLRVQSGREDFVKETIEKRVEADNMSDKIGRIIIQSEKVTEIKSGKKRVVDRKIFPGYMMVEMILDEDTWYFIRETPGIGDFLGTEKPSPMGEREVIAMLAETISGDEDKPKLKINFKSGDNVRIKEGPFENFDGVVEEVNSQKGIVKVIVTIFGRPTPVEMEYWQIESV